MRVLFIIFAFATLQVNAQALRIPGQVLDTNRNPIENATITLTGTNSSSITDVSGIYSLELPNSVKKGTLISLHIKKAGYHSVTKHIAASPLIVTTILKKIKGYKAVVSSPPKSNNISQVASVSPTLPSSNYGIQHTVYGNNSGINGDVNINQEKRLTESDQAGLLAFIENLKKDKNFNPTCFTLLFTTGSNGGKFGEDIASFLKNKGYNMNGTGTAFGNGILKGVEIGRMGTTDCLTITIGNL